MRKVYVVCFIEASSIVKEVSFFSTLDANISYGNLILEPIEEFLSRDDAEVWIRRNGIEGNDYTIVEIFRK
jgi:hypothetical protein